MTPKLYETIESPLEAQIIRILLLVDRKNIELGVGPNLLQSKVERP